MRGFWVRAWSEDQDVHTAEDMSAVAGRAGMDQRTIGECLEAARSQEVKQRLKEVTAEAVDRGAFGSPTMFFSEGEADTEHMFWGSDRSEHGTVITLPHLRCGQVRDGGGGVRQAVAGAGPRHHAAQILRRGDWRGTLGWALNRLVITINAVLYLDTVANLQMQKS